ncbi:hypothetical protein ACIA5D_40265 [Actinoplanes sp. NPDC051513]|uniref:hypothetical protein n=1 Tax=Actinoplanes sp. NPDC051513 TaxID=3363908 RepID=UPI0037878755
MQRESAIQCGPRRLVDRAIAAFDVEARGGERLFELRRAQPVAVGELVAADPAPLARGEAQEVDQSRPKRRWIS